MTEELKMGALTEVVKRLETVTKQDWGKNGLGTWLSLSRVDWGLAW